MTKRSLWIFMILALVAMLTVGCGLLQEPAAPSTELEAVPLDGQTPEAAAEIQVTSEAEAAPAMETTAEPVLEDTGSTTDPEEQQATADETNATNDAQADASEPAADSGGNLIIFTIDPASSEVRFELDEVLRGNPTTVVGKTDQVAGQVGVDMNDLSTTQVGVITINARALATDNNFRNRAIQNEILDTGAYEFITFTPTAVNGLPASVGVGETVEFTIDGDLVIRDITLPVTFDVSAALVSETQLAGSANTIISREDFNLNIPQVPNVANVEPEVELTIDFVANAS